MHQPKKAELAIARKLRAVVRGPLGVLLFSHLLARLDDYTDEEIFQKTKLENDLDFSDLYLNANYQGRAKTWMQIMYELADDSVSNLYDDSNSGYAFEHISEQSNYLWRSTTENMTVALELIHAGHLAIAEALGDDTPSEDGIAEILYNNIEELGWIASTNRKTIAKALPSANGHKPPKVVNIGGEFDNQLRKVFRFANGILTPNHRSLKEGGWRWPGNCSRRWRHRLPDTALPTKAKNYFTNVGHPELFSKDSTNFQAIRGLLAAGIEVGRHTILISDDTPTYRGRNNPDEYPLDG